MECIYADAGRHYYSYKGAAPAMVPCIRREACIELSIVHRRINDVLQF